MVHRALLLLYLLAVSACGAVSYHGTESTSAEVPNCSHDNAFERLLDGSVTVGGPGAALIITLRGEVLYASYRGLAGIEETPELDNEQVLELLLEEKEMDFTLGERFEYSNANYVLAAEVVASASGMDFSRFLEEEVFLPLGMDHALVRDDPSISIPNVAQGYRGTPQGFVRIESPAPIVGDGGIFASPTDFVAWERGLTERRLVADALYEDAFRSGRLNDSSETGYGLGWFVDLGKNDRPIVEHTGSWAGFRHAIIRSLADGLTVMVFSNLESFSPAPLAREALSLARDAVHDCE
jgi:CubicO group peptidase (beta-lactamase class C family)